MSGIAFRTIGILAVTAGCGGIDPLDVDPTEQNDSVPPSDTATEAPRGTGTDTPAPCEDGGCCVASGVVYELGEQVDIECEGCENTCRCEADSQGSRWTCSECECQGTCEYNGAVYAAGDEFYAEDGCNRCECRKVNLGFGFSELRVTCTDDDCEPPTCDINGAWYDIGDMVDVPCEGCENRCTCERIDDTAAEWSCTDCECADTCVDNSIEYAPGDRFLAPDGCNQCECVMVDLPMEYTEAQVQCTNAACDGPRCFSFGVDYEIGEVTNIYCLDGGTVGMSCTCQADPAGGEMPIWDCTDGACPQACEYLDVVYQLGERFLASDGCSTCECALIDRGLGLMQATVQCEWERCEPPTCTEEGVEYPVGEVVEVRCDGCRNTCACERTDLDHAAWSCTDACRCAQTCGYEGQTYAPGEAFTAADGCTECRCVTAELAFDYTEARVVCSSEGC